MSTASPPFETLFRSDERRVHTLSRAAVLSLVGFAALLVLTVIHIRQGTAQISTSTVFDALFFPDGSTQHQVVRFARLPRVAAGITAGAALGIAGVMLQAATRNPLASASTVGVNAGAYLAVVAATIYAPSLMTFSSTLVAFGGGLLAAALVAVLAAGSTSAPTRLALAGMATTISLGSITTVLIMFHDYTVAGLYFWGSGSLVQRNWENVAGAWPWVLIIGLVATVIQGRQLDILWLGDDVAESLGQRVARTRLITIALGVLLAAFAVTVAGMIGFVGLVAPHLVRMAGIKHHRLLIPIAALWGAVILVGADVVGRIVAGPMDELPAGIFTAIVGAPWLIWLARQTGGHGVRQGAGSTGMTGFRGTDQRLVWSITAGALIVIIVAGMALGDEFKSVSTLWEVVTVRADALNSDFVTNQRLPRIIVSGLVGAALSVSGLMIQGVVRNPLASPDLVGVAPGAGVGAVAVLIAFPDMPLGWLPLAAAAGGVIAFAVVYAASWSGGISPLRLALVGVGVSAACGSIITMMVVTSGFNMVTALSWLSGSTYARDWGNARQLLPWLVVLLPLAWICARWLDVMALGEDIPRSLGVSLERARIAVLAIAVGLAAAAVAICGTIGFVGLICPHATRMLISGRHRWQIPYAAILGAILVIAADMLGRTVIPNREVPTGLVTALIGTPTSSGCFPVRGSLPDDTEPPIETNARMTSTPPTGITAVRPKIEFCSVVSAESGEDPIGSAWHCGRYVLVELPLPWKYNSLESIHAPKGLGTLLTDLWDLGHRWGFIGFAPDEEHSVAEMTRVIDYQLPAPPFARYVRTEYLFPTERAVELLRSMATDPESDDLAAFRVDTDPALRDVFVCTHGAIDACCATFGYPIYKLLRHMAQNQESGFRVWRCTHFGGHRFAATVLDMPEGRYWGHLSARDLAPFIRRNRPFAELRHRYRGWAALPHPLQQVAEGAAFLAAGWEWTSRLVRVDEPVATVGEQQVRIDYRHPGSGEEGSMVVEIIPDGTVTTMHASNSSEFHEAPQFRTRIVDG